MARLYDGEKGAQDFASFKAVLNFVNQELVAVEGSESWSPEVRLVLTWVHACRLHDLMRIVGFSSMELQSQLDTRRGPLRSALVRDGEPWFDCAHPLRLKRTSLLTHGMARLLWGIDSSPLEDQDTTMSYDGYGRVKTKHVPQQQVDANNSASTNHTTWDYNSDDTVQKMTDARGVITNFEYNNNRRLVTSVVYDSSNVPASANVSAAVGTSFTYDAVGNRISMTDGLGSTIYGYDQLSRMTSETRYINSVGSFPLNYAYNLAGELTGVTDPFGQSVGYTHDSVGRTSGITGSGFGSVTQFTSNIYYRASGGTKAMNYGNGKTLAVNYNARLQPATYTVPGQIDKAYQYYADGQLKYAQDLMDARFDRLHKYDQVARLTEARTGTEASGGNVMDGPYSESFAYDVWGQTTARTTQQWSEGAYDDTASYTNGRRNLWQYDANGRLTSDFNWQKTYDAAGRVVRSEPAPQSGDSTSITTSGYDGDGQRLKTGYQLTYIYQPSFSYHLYSTVLGGQVIAEIQPNGQKTLGYVYDENGQLLSLTASDQVEWQHVDPAGMSARRTFSGGNYGVSGAELDAVSADMKLSDPGPPEEAPPAPDENSPNAREYGNPTRPATGCSYSHVQMSCSDVMALVNSKGSLAMLEMFAQASTRVIGTRTITEHFKVKQYSARKEDDPDTDIVHVGTTQEYSFTRTTVVSLYDESWSAGLLSVQEGLTEPLIKLLPGFSDTIQQRILQTIRSISDNKNCAEAFRKNGLNPVAGLVVNGLVIGQATLLSNPDNTAMIGITEDARRRDLAGVGSTDIQAFTTKDWPGVREKYTTDGRARIFLNASAFGGGKLSLREVLVHEFLHVAGWPPAEVGFFGELTGKTDLSHYKNYETIMAACK